MLLFAEEAPGFESWILCVDMREEIPAARKDS